MSKCYVLGAKRYLSVKKQNGELTVTAAEEDYDKSASFACTTCHCSERCRGELGVDAGEAVPEVQPSRVGHVFTRVYD